MSEPARPPAAIFTSFDGKRLALNPANVVGVFETDDPNLTTITTVGRAGPLVSVKGDFDSAVRELFYPLHRDGDD